MHCWLRRAQLNSNCLPAIYPYPTVQPRCYTIFSDSFLSTKFDLFLVIKAAQAGLLPLYPCRPKPWESFVSNGSIIAYIYGASEDPKDWDCWNIVNEDKTFEIAESTDFRKLMRKKASVQIDSKILIIFLYYRQWDTTNGILVPPLRCLDFEGIYLRKIFTIQDDLQFLSPIEAFRSNLEV